MSKKNKKKKTTAPKQGSVSQVQVLHDEIASVLLGQIREQRKEAEESEDKHDTLTVCVDPKTIDNAIKLLRLNKTTAREDELDDQDKAEVSELERLKKEQRGRVSSAMKED